MMSQRYCDLWYLSVVVDLVRVVNKDEGEGVCI